MGAGTLFIGLGLHELPELSDRRPRPEGPLEGNSQPGVATSRMEKDCNRLSHYLNC